MYKIFLMILFSVALNAELVNGVAIVVKGEAITLYDLKEEMRISKVSLNNATDVLIRKKLEAVEIKERNIKVSNSEVFDDIKQTASRNKMSVSDFYEAVRNANGMNSEQLKVKTKEKLLSQKLYGAIAYSSIEEPSEDEMKEYFELHKSDFAHPSGFRVVINNAKDKALLQKKIDNTMFYSPAIREDEQRLPYDRISPELASFLEKQKEKTFTPIIPDGKGGHMTFYVKEIESAKEMGYEKVKNQIINLIMGNKREQVLSDYFARLRGNADIKVLREVE